jgi:hypothetical protein
MQDKNKSSSCQVGYFHKFRGFYFIFHKGHCVCVCVFTTITNPTNKLLDRIEWGYQLSSLVVEDIIKLLSSNKGHIIELSPYILIANAIFLLTLTNYNMIPLQNSFS